MSTGWGTVAEHPARVAVGELDAALDRLGEANLWSLSPAEVRQLRVDLERLSARLSATTLTVTNELEASGAGVEVGAVSTAGWLRGTCRLDPRAAKREVRLAAALHGPLGATGQALAAGELTTEHAEVIRNAIDRLPAAASDMRRDGEAWLVDQAKIFDPQALGHLGRHLRHVTDPDGEGRLRSDLEAEEAEHHRNRSFSLIRRHDGARLARGLLDPEAGALLEAALDAVSAPAPAADGTPDPRSPGQRRADGLLELVRLALHSPSMPEDGGEPVTLVVTVPLATLEGRLAERLRDQPAGSHGILVGDVVVEDAAMHRSAATAAELSDGTPVSAETARRLACDAYIMAAVLGVKGEVLDIGRLSRNPTRAMRRALVVRDGGCAFPGCGRPPRWCHAHHIRHWACLGPTCLGNLVLLCGRHHRVIHHEGWAVRIGADGHPLFRPPRWIDPDQIELPSWNTSRRHALDHIPL